MRQLILGLDVSKSEIMAVREKGGYLFLENLSLIELSGKDSESFLQGRTSNDVRSLRPEQGQLSSFLDRKGYLLAFVSVHRLKSDSFIILSEARQSRIILKEFATYHFREDISYAETADRYKCIAIQGPLIDKLLSDSCQIENLKQEEYSVSESILFGKKVRTVKRSYCGESGYLLLVSNQDFEPFFNSFEALALKNDIVRISQDSLETMRIEAGLPSFGKDMGPEDLLPETGMEQYAASYSKGCFQGQEVLARIKTYGAPKKALVGLIFDNDVPATIEPSTKFYIDSQEAGSIKSNTYSPSLEKFIALAYIARDYRVPDRRVKIRISDIEYDATVKFLPFYSGLEKKQKAQKLYESALREFATGSEENAIEMLRNSIELNPLLQDAYESLGVILSRHGKYDEAIALMHRLNELDPDSVMAHTNLSIYYMQLGDKERAEEEKAISMSLRMSSLAKEQAKKKQEEKDREKQLAEAEKRLSMFKQVLEIDADDFLANSGAGTVYVEIGKFSEALPFLQKAIAAKPTHTVAYLSLGKAYEELGEIEDAAKVYEAGIEVAARRGDITPMKEMQSLLDSLKEKEANLTN